MHPVWRGCVAAIGFLACVAPCLAAPPCEGWIARLASVEGRVETRQGGSPIWERAVPEQRLCPGDSVRTDSRSRAVVSLRSNAALRLDSATSLTLPPADLPGSWLDLLRGAFHYLSHRPQSLRIRTPFVNAAVEGTEFMLAVEDARTLLTVFDGRVVASNADGSVAAGKGEGVVAEAGRAPRGHLPVRPRQAVQWALYYPPVVDARVAARGVVLSPEAREALEPYRRGDTAGALERLEGVAAHGRDAGFHALRAAFALALGRVREAEADIARALALDPGEAQAVALQSVVATVRGEDARALELASRSAELAPRSPVPRIALSYALQGAFRLEEALSSAREAVALSPDDALAWARVAELWLSLGELARALDAAREASARNPDLSRTQTVLGYAHLTRIEIEEAQAAFARAIALDQGDPLPRLGLGIARIRRGGLEAGRQEIEVAASLDPNSALIRSYLGKAYFEEHRDDVAQRELGIAKELDPKDPTPWLYDAIVKQFGNRPVEALADLRRSMELNGNRAVYRSSLLLDEDQAARSVSLARIYNDLGFDQAAQMEAARSLSLDPANASAHRFLSDAYMNRPRHEIARVSELLQAQLLQPVGNNPVQPEMAETSLNLASASWSPRTGLNELSSLYARDGPRLHAAGGAGSHGMWATELIAFGTSGPLSYSAGAFGYRTQGFRDGAELRHEVRNLFVQGEVSPDFNAQFEYRERFSRQGYLGLDWDPANASVDHSTIRQGLYRFGIHWKPSIDQDVVASVIQLGRNTSRNFPDPGNGIAIYENHGKAFDAQGRYLVRGNTWNATFGLGDYRSHALRFDRYLPLVGAMTTDVSDSDLRQRNWFAYADFQLPGRMSGTLGFSADQFLTDWAQIRSLHPKFGMRWEPFEGVFLRAAVLRAVKRQLISQQTLEPTEVAGFNQFFDDFNGSLSRLKAIGMDIASRHDLRAGAEVVDREVREPVTIGEFAPPIVERTARANLGWAPASSWAIAGELRREKYSGDQLAPAFARMTTLFFPVSARYFSPAGWVVRARVRTVAQSIEGHTERFSIADAGMSWRLPARRGEISIDANNVFGRRFRYQDRRVVMADPFKADAEYLPGRQLAFRVVLGFQ